MKINVYNQDNFRISSGFSDSNVDSFVDDYFICINSTGSYYSTPVFKINHPNVLNIYFDDTEKDKIKIAGDIVYFATACTDKDAKIIKDFIDKIPDNSNIHVYCAKGKSRSTAVAKFIEEYKKINNKTQFKIYNLYIYNLLWKQI
jgi:predicted protein tyrosine phosphatase